MSDSAATEAFKLATLPGRERILSEKVMMVVTRLVGSELIGRVFRKFKSPAGRAEAATERAGKLLKLPSWPNFVGLIDARSCRTPKVGTESWTTGSWKRKLGTMPLRTDRMLPVMAPRPVPPGTAMFLAIEPTRKDRSGGMPKHIVSY